MFWELNSPLFPIRTIELFCQCVSPNRNNWGYKLARNLLGTASLLDEQGINYFPTPYKLFKQYSNRCNPPVDNDERERIWKSACSKPAYPSRDYYSILGSIRQWLA